MGEKSGREKEVLNGVSSSSKDGSWMAGLPEGQRLLPRERRRERKLGAFILSVCLVWAGESCEIGQINADCRGFYFRDMAVVYGFNYEYGLLFTLWLLTWN